MRPGLLYKAYAAISSLLVPMALLISLCFSRGRIRVLERLGFWKQALPCDWWFHGASVGEIQGILPLVKAIKLREPESRILITATSPTGLPLVSEIADCAQLLPFDSPWCVRRALKRIRAKRLIITETELWPVLLTESIVHGIECSLVNARISDYTAPWYKLIRSLFTPSLQCMSSVCVVAEKDRVRFVELGAADAIVHVTGNTKYDIALLPNSESVSGELRSTLFPDLGKNSRVVVLGSIRPGEEEYWFPAIKKIIQSGDDLRVVVVPRHAEKFEYFRTKIEASGLTWGSYSKLQECPSDMKIVLIDTMGLLRTLYGVADLSFIGATLIDVGGHNPLEAAMYGCPVCVGPFTSVVEDICQTLQEEGALIRVTTENDVYNLLKKVCERENPFKTLGEAGKAVWKRYTGATDLVLSHLMKTS